jgi:uncharacterized protein DUF2846
MRRLIRISDLVIIVMVLSSCASGPKFTEIKPDMSARNPDMGRIFFYRPSALGILLNPDVKLNGERVGEAKSQGFFFVDRPAGDYVAVTSTEVDRKVSFTLDKGQTRFIRFSVTLGFFAGHVYGEVVDEAEAKGEIVDCKYIGGQDTHH